MEKQVIKCDAKTKELIINLVADSDYCMVPQEFCQDAIDKGMDCKECMLENIEWVTT